MHAVYHRVQRGECLVGAVSVRQRVVGRVFEGREDMFFLALDDALYGLKISAGEFMGESEEWLVLFFFFFFLG